MVKHLRWRAANSLGLSRDSRKASEEMAGDAEFFAEQAAEFNALADALERADITLPASGTPTQRAETTGSVGEADGGPTRQGDAQNTLHRDSSEANNPLETDNGD